MLFDKLNTKKMTILFIEHLNINAIVRKMLNFKRCHPDLEETEIHIRMIN